MNFASEVRDASPGLEELRGTLRQLILQYGAFDRERSWVNLDQLWHVPRAFIPYTEVVRAYVRLELGDELPPDTVFLVADTLRSSFGMLPAVAVVAHQLGCSLTVWKELGDLTWGLSRFFPEPEPDKTCVVVQDVVRWGTTVLKIAADLKEHNWYLRAYLAMVQVSGAESQLHATIEELKKTGQTTSDFRFRALLRTGDLME